MSEWPEVARLCHLKGGLNALCPPGNRFTIDNDPTEYQIASYPDLFGKLESLGLSVLGVDFYYSNEQLQDIRAPEWRVFFGGVGWKVHESIDLAGKVSVGANNDNNFHLADLSRRIQFELRAMSWRYREISKSYQQTRQYYQLANRVPETGSWFQYADTFLLYIALHSYFAHFGALRDYLAEFCSSYLFAEVFQQPSNIKKIPSLIKGLKKYDGTANPLRDSILEMADDTKEGWLAQASHYRDIVLHYSPFHTHGDYIGMRSRRKLVNGNEVFAIDCPIPINPKEFKSARAGGTPFATLAAWHRHLMGNLDPVDVLDALEYSHELLSNMSDLTLSVLEGSPSIPVRRTLTEDDLLGPPKIIS